jgi:hypothetical protein
MHAASKPHAIRFISLFKRELGFSYRVSDTIGTAELSNSSPAFRISRIWVGWLVRFAPDSLRTRNTDASSSQLPQSGASCGRKCMRNSDKHEKRPEYKNGKADPLSRCAATSSLLPRIPYTAPKSVFGRRLTQGEGSDAGRIQQDVDRCGTSVLYDCLKHSCMKTWSLTGRG